MHQEECMWFVQVRQSGNGEILYDGIPLNQEKLQAFKAALHILIAKHLELHEEWVVLWWQRISPNRIRCTYLISKPAESIQGDSDVCWICERPCEDADDVWSAMNGLSRETNCIECLPCFLCDACRVDLNGIFKCIGCLERREVENLEFLDPRRARRREWLILPWLDSSDSSSDG